MSFEASYVSDDESAKRLADRVRSTRRPPLVIITTKRDSHESPLDVEALNRRLDGAAEVYLIKGAGPSYAFRDAIGGNRSAVHSGWIRVYPEVDWDIGDQNSNRINVGSAQNVNRVVQLVEERVNSTYAFQASSPPQMDQTLVPATAEIIDSPVAGGNALTVRLLDRNGPLSAFFSYKGLMAGLPPERLLKKGMKFTGKRSLSIIPTFYPDIPSDDPHLRTLKYVGDGRCFWVYVDSVGSISATVLLHPLVPSTIMNQNERDLSLEFSPGDTFAAYVMFDEEAEHFVIDTAPPDEKIDDAISVYPYGPPWLLPVTETVTKEEGQIHSDDDTAEYLEYQISLQKREDLIDRLKEEVRRLRSMNRKSEHFYTLEEEFRRDVALSYFQKMSGNTDRARFVFNDHFVIAPGFIDSVFKLVRSGGITYDRVVEVCAMVVCGNFGFLHTKKFENFNSDLDMVGWTTFRANLQTESKSARRLRYSIKGHTIRLELASLHDDEIS